MANTDFTVKNGLQVNGGTWVVNSTAIFYQGSQVANSSFFSGQANTANLASVATQAINANTANNALYLGGGTAASYVNTSANFTLSGNITFSGTKVDINGRIGAGGANYGTSGQVLTSGGPSTSPSWQTIFPAGTAMLFAQETAPTGWTKSVVHNDKALRVVSGAAGSGGSVAFSTAFSSKSVAGSISSQSVSGTVGGTTLTSGQMPFHTHLTVGTTSAGLSSTSAIRDAAIYGSQNNYDLTGASNWTLGLTSSAGNSESHTHSFTGGSHSHTFTGTAINMAVQYVDVIIATKD